jgi:hypothetical protein
LVFSGEHGTWGDTGQSAPFFGRNHLTPPLAKERVRSAVRTFASAKTDALPST